MSGKSILAARETAPDVARAVPGRASVGLSDSIRQACLIGLILAATGGLAWIGLGNPARILYMVCAVATAAWYQRRSPWLYLTLTFWFWTVTPFIRRVVDYRSGFDAMNIILATPNVIALLMLKDILRSRDLFRHRETMIGLMLLLPALYGLVVNLVQGQIVNGAVGAADWIAPLLYLFYLVEKAPDIVASEPHLRGFIALNTLVITGYGLYQFWMPPIWDVSWALSTGDLGPGDVAAKHFVVFSTLNAPGVLAEWLGALILLSVYFRTRLTPILLPALCLLLLLTHVRSVTGGVLLSLGVASLLGGGRMVSNLGRLLAALAILLIVIANLDTTIGASLIDRFGSVGALGTDDSALTRLSIWSNAPAVIDAHPLGLGIGALGRGAVVSGNADLVSIDAGPLAIYLSLGWIAGTVYLLGMLAVLGQALRIAYRLRSSAAIAFAAAALCSLMELPFVNVSGFAGAVLWLSGGFVMAHGVRARLS